MMMRAVLRALTCALLVCACAAGTAHAITVSPSSTVATYLGRVRLTEGVLSVECGLLAMLRILSPIGLPMSGILSGPVGYVGNIAFDCGSSGSSIEPVDEHVLQLTAWGWNLYPAGILGTLGSQYTGIKLSFLFHLDMMLLGGPYCRYDGSITFLMENGARKQVQPGILRLPSSTCDSLSWPSMATYSPATTIS